MYCFTTSISHGVEKYFCRLWGTGISNAIFFRISVTIAFVFIFIVNVTFGFVFMLSLYMYLRLPLFPLKEDMLPICPCFIFKIEKYSNNSVPNLSEIDRNNFLGDAPSCI